MYIDGYEEFSDDKIKKMDVKYYPSTLKLD